jgi:glycosyltransferase involved in cell wall biosynthesis
MNPKVSVVIPTYERAGKVQKTIDSVLAQTFTDYEVIVVDDGSSDGTGKIVTEKYGERIRYYFQKNSGVSVARNRGIAEARGGWIAFLDSDDVWEPEKLREQLRALEQIGPQFGGCYTDVHLLNFPETRTFFQLADESFHHEGSIGESTEALRLLVRPGGAGMVICLSSFMARADLLKNSPGFDPKILYSQDSDFLFRLAMRTRFCYVNRPLVGFDRSPVETRHVGVSSDWNKLEFFLKDSQLRLEGLLGMSDKLPSKVQRVIREQLSSVHSGWATWYLEAGEYGKARNALLAAARLDLTRKIAAKWVLTCVSPRLALRAIHNHQERTKGSGIV